MFKASTYMERRNRLKKQVGSGIILLPGNDESPMNYADNQFHFRQDSTFLYFFGLDFPGLVGMIDIDNNKDYIFGDDFTIDDIVWMGPQQTIKEKCMECGIENSDSLNKIESILKKYSLDKKMIHYLPPYRPETMLKLFNWLNIDPRNLHDHASIDLIKAIVEQRITKSQEEISEIDKAASISADMHLTAMRMLRPGMKEMEIMAAVHQVALKSGGNLSFPIIATRNGQTLHNHFYGNIVEEGQLFLLDAGAETTMHYAGDLSSTFPVGLKFTEKQKTIYEVALMSHEHAVSLLKPGVNFKDVHLSVCKVIATGMKELGFLKGNIDDIVNEGAHAMFFPCGTGHSLGLDVHDMENLGEIYVGYEGKPKSKQFGLKSLRLGRKLEPGFVLTIEPGIYFIPELMNKWKRENKFTDFLNYDKIEQYINFGGCRNEENYLITNSGARLLGKPLPKTVAGVEIIRSESWN